MTLRKGWPFILLGLVALGGIFVAVEYFTSEEYRQRKEAERIVEQVKREYAEDPYGGDTPEETLRLFIESLKKGDVELAAKYFVIDKQEEWREELTRIKERNLLEDMVSDFETAQRSRDISPESAVFSVVNENNEVVAMVNVGKAPNGKWKILDL